MKREPSICENETRGRSTWFEGSQHRSFDQVIQSIGISHHKPRTHLLALPLLALGLEDVDDDVGGRGQDLRHGLVLALQDHQVLRLHL